MSDPITAADLYDLARERNNPVEAAGLLRQALSMAEAACNARSSWAPRKLKAIIASIPRDPGSPASFREVNLATAADRLIERGEISASVHVSEVPTDQIVREARVMGLIGLIGPGTKVIIQLAEYSTYLASLAGKE